MLSSWPVTSCYVRLRSLNLVLGGGGGFGRISLFVRCKKARILTPVFLVVRLVPCVSRHRASNCLINTSVQRWDVWLFTKILPFLGVVRYFPLFTAFFRLLLPLLYHAVLRSFHPRSPRRTETPGRHDVRKSRQWCAGVGKLHLFLPPPFPLRMRAVVCWPGSGAWIICPKTET